MSSVSAGVRRIEATTGNGVLALIAEQQALIASTARELKVPNPNDIARKALQLHGEISEMKKEIEALNAKIALSKVDDILKNTQDLGSFKLAVAKCPDMQIETARMLTDQIKSTHPDLVTVLAIVSCDKLNFLAAAGKEALAHGAHAGRLVSAVSAITGGKGGGRPDNAMAGGQDITKIDEALNAAAGILSAMLK